MEAITVINTLSDELKHEPYNCKINNSKPEILPGFAPFNMTTVICRGLDYLEENFQFAVCSKMCIDPVTHKFLPRRRHAAKEVMSIEYIRKGENKTKINRPIACKCTSVKQKKGRRKTRKNRRGKRPRRN